METMVKEHRDYLEAEKANWEMVQHGFVRNLDLPVLKMYEHIYRLYLDPNFVLTVWCSNCVMDMIRRLYKHYESLPIENDFYQNVDVSKLEDISDRVEIKETTEGIEVTLKPEPKKRGRKPKK